MGEALKNTSTLLDVQEIRRQFPVLDQQVNNYPLVYFDNAATTQKPYSVIQKLDDYYKGYNSNIHRGIHHLAEKATTAYEDTRKTVAKFINSPEVEQIIFTRGTTEGLNLIASTYGRQELKEGDEIIISTMEHHSNIVPWQMLCNEKGAELKIIPINDAGEIIFEEFIKLLSSKTRIVATCSASNTLGTINPVKKMAQATHDAGAVFVIDGAQAAPHLNIDVQDIDCDFFTFSSHKMYGPTGVGVLYGKRELLEKMPPYQGGGEMIKDVTFNQTTYNDIPYKFEAGTPNIGDVIAFNAAVEFLNHLGKENIAIHEEELLQYAIDAWSQIPGFTPIGTSEKKVSLQSFIVEGIHHFDIGMMLDANGIAVRTGHHCTQPLMDRFGVEGTVRASFALYNTKEEIDSMTSALNKIISLLRK